MTTLARIFQYITYWCLTLLVLVLCVPLYIFAITFRLFKEVADALIKVLEAIKPG